MKSVNSESCSVEVVLVGNWSTELGDHIRVTQVVTRAGQKEPCARKRLEEYAKDIRDQGGIIYQGESTTQGTCLMELFSEGNVFSRARRLNPFNLLNKKLTDILVQVPKAGSKTIKCQFKGCCIYDFVNGDS